MRAIPLLAAIALGIGFCLPVEVRGDDVAQWSQYSSTTGDLDQPNGGSQQTAALVLDIDGDLVNDFVITERSQAPAVTWYRRTADGWIRHVLEAGQLSIEAGGSFADIDGDGDLDVSFGGDYGTNQVWWWENPSPSFDPAVPWTRYLIKNSGSTNHHDQAFGDFDGDGRLELAFWNQHAGGKLYVAEIPADPKATEPWIYVEVFDGADNSEGMAVADIDGDGVDDIVGAGYWFKHVGGSSLSASLIVSGRPYTRTAVGDLIPGGRPEVVIVPGDANGSLDYYEWNGATWDEHEIHSYVIHGHSIGVGDVNLDGHLDVFVGEMGNPGDGANCDGWVFYGDGAGTFDQQVVSTGVANHESRLADLDGDGDLDILAKPYNYGAPRVDVFLNGTLTLPELGFEQAVIDVAGVAYERAVGDIDRDGRNDIIATPHAPSGELWLYLAPDFVRQVPLTLDSGTHGYPHFRADDVQLADFDADGDLDIAVRIGDSGDLNGKVVWIENPLTGCHDISGTWVVHDIGVNAYTKDIVVADFDRDSRTDIATREDGRTQVWFNDGPDTWVKVEIAHSGHEGMDVGDLDGDQDPDLVLNGFWLETPADPRIGTYAQHTIDEKWFTQSVGWESNSCKVAVADVDGDGAKDVVLSQSEYTGYPVSWYSAVDPAGGPWSEHIVVPVCDDCHNLQVVDFDLDGHVDVLYGGMPQSAQSGLHLALGDGGSTWTPFEIQAQGSYSAELGDIDDDGDWDIVGIRNWNTAPTEIWRNTLIEPVSPFALDQWEYIEVDDDRVRWGSMSYFGLGWGDVNADGYLDLVSGRYFYRNPGGDMTAAPWPVVEFNVGANVDASLVVNVDGDVFGDVIASTGPQIHWLEAGDTDGTSWTSYVVDTDAPYEPGHVIPQGYAIADLVPGGRPEVVFSNGDQVYYYEIPATNPDAGEWPMTVVLDQSNSEDIGIGDVDGDGLLDVAAAHWTGSGAKSIKWARNPGDGSGDWAESIVGEVVPAGGGQYPDRVKIADLNGDHRPDIVCSEEISSQPASTYWFEAPVDPTQVPWLRHLIVTQYTTNSMDVADMDNDGDIDVITQEHRGTEKLQIWENDGCGVFSENVIDTGKEGHLGARVADLDQDGDYEIFSIAFDSYQYLHLWRNDNGPGGGQINHPPVAQDGAFAVEPNDTYSGNVIAVDPDPLDTLEYEVVDQPTAGTLTSFNAASGAFTYLAPALLTADSFTFRATDGDQASSNVATISISVQEINEPPVAVIQVDTTTPGEAPATVNLDAMNSFDPDGTINTYTWDFGDSSGSDQPVVAHTFTEDGVYIVTLAVEDNEGGTDTDTVQVYVGAFAEGLIGYWPFDEDGGAVAADFSGWGNHLTLHNGADWGDGLFGAALVLDGTDDYASRPDGDLVGAFPAKGDGSGEDFTISAWINLDLLGHRHPIVQKQGDGQRGLNFTVEEDNRLTCELFRDQINETEFASSVTLEAGIWYHVALTYDYIADLSSVATLYVDGTEVGDSQSAVGPLVPNAVDLNFGRYYWGPSYERCLNGRMDEVRVYERALAGPEIAALAWRPPDGDYDDDGVVDDDDTAALAACMTGPVTTATDECRRAFDFDGDLDVDMLDAAKFQVVFNSVVP